MPRGRKRTVSAVSTAEKSEESAPEPKREARNEEVEEEFIEVELDEAPSTSAAALLAAADEADAAAAAEAEAAAAAETEAVTADAEQQQQEPDEEDHHQEEEGDEPEPEAAKKDEAPPTRGTRTALVRKSMPLPIPPVQEQKPPQAPGRTPRSRKPFVPRARSAPRTRAQALHESVMEMVAAKEEPRDEEEAVEDVHDVSIELNDCEFCDTRLHSKIELNEHKRAFHKDQVHIAAPPSGSLMCSHPHCSSSFPDVNHLISHLVAFHNQPQYRIRKITFEEIDRFESWQNEMQKNARCVFLAMEPEGDSNDHYKVEMYCEFCDEWRVQEEKGVTDPHQIMRKIVGCPAHFTATINNKRGKAVVVGCFAHLGHHKKSSWSTMPNPQEGRTVRNVATTKCSTCGLMFRSRTACSRHHRIIHDGIPIEEVDRRRGPSEPKMPSLECGDPDCDVMCDSMATLVQHVAQAHSRTDLTIEEYKFDSLEDFEAWKSRVESETCSRFCKVSGRVLPNEITKYFLCHLSGHTNRTKKKSDTPLEKQRNRPTKKMGRYCTAHMNFKFNKLDNSVTIRGCLGHFGHNFDVRRLPLPEQVRKEVSDLLLKGHMEDDVVQIIRSKYTDEERGYWLQRYEVRNICLKLQREGHIAAKTYAPIGIEEDGRFYDEMGYDEGGEPFTTFIPSSHVGRSKLVQYKAIRQGPGIIGIGPNQTTRVYAPRKIEPVEVVQYVDEDSEYTGEELVEMRELEGDDGMDEQVFYEQQLVAEEMEDEEEIQRHLASSSMSSSRKRMPLLKEPKFTGNHLLDDVMQRMKDRFIKISHELKRSRDIQTANQLYKELKELEARMGISGSSSTDLEIGPPRAGQWSEEFYGVEYRMEPVGVEHEEEVNAARHHHGFDYMEEHPEEDVVDETGRAEVVVEAEEIVS